MGDGVLYHVSKSFCGRLVKNLLDRNYYYNAGFPQAGRTWFLNVRYTF